MDKGVRQRGDRDDRDEMRLCAHIVVKLIFKYKRYFGNISYFEV